MIEIKGTKELARIRRHALGAQGLLQTRPFGTGRVGALKAIRQLGYVQIDTISVVERAHHHVIYSRVPGFAPPMTNQLLRDGEIFEYWAHAAAFLPMADFRFSLPYKHALRDGQIHWYKHRDVELMNELLARIRSDGPLRSRDLEDPDAKRAGWWDWKPAKRALEQLYMEGELMISDREGFQKTYDLTERVLPSNVDTTLPDIEEFAAHLLDQQLRSHAFVSMKGLTYLRRNAGLRSAVKALVDDRLAQRELEQGRLDSGEIFIGAAGTLEGPVPRVTNRLSILSPFDNSVIQRERLNALFQFPYQLECYLPEAKRRFGYFCLPLLYRDEFVGRMDCKAHRKTGQFEIKQLHFEHYQCHEDELLGAFAQTLKDFMQFQNCRSVSLGQVSPVHLTQRLRSALEAIMECS
jgi:uncharacterized protein YcaQ